MTAAPPTYVRLPGLVRTSRGAQGFSLYHPGHGTSLDIEGPTTALVETALQAFAEPRTPEDFFAAHPGFPEELLEVLASAFFLVRTDEQAFLEHGFLRPAAGPLGAPCEWSDMAELADPCDWVVVGVPSDAGTLGEAGARNGPAAVRKRVNGALLMAEGDVVDYELGRLYRDLQPRVADLGDVDPEGGRLDHVGARVAKVVRQLSALALRPLLIGGDHALTHFVLEELVRRGEPFGVLHFDAHQDMLPSRALSHASIFEPILAASCVESLVQIGLRGLERVSPFAARVPCDKRRFVTARQARAGEALRLLETLPTDVPYYLSIDIDVVDGALAPETGTPSLGGLSVELTLELVDFVARTFRLLGADIVEVAGPAHGGRNTAASVAASLLERIVIGAAPYQRLTSDIYHFPS